jgi:hypothetical protein
LKNLSFKYNDCDQTLEAEQESADALSAHLTVSNGDKNGKQGIQRGGTVICRFPATVIVDIFS